MFLGEVSCRKSLWGLYGEIFNCRPSALSSSGTTPPPPPPGVKTLMVVANDPSDTDGATEADKFEETGWRWGGGGDGGFRQQQHELTVEREHI